tara:strand:+ start:147 stop:434 length:288 start_codon:yes stop_codon:yes gene_type:complete
VAAKEALRTLKRHSKSQIKADFKIYFQNLLLTSPLWNMEEMKDLKTSLKIQTTLSKSVTQPHRQANSHRRPYFLSPPAGNLPYSNSTEIKSSEEQ